MDRRNRQRKIRHLEKEISRAEKLLTDGRANLPDASDSGKKPTVQADGEDAQLTPDCDFGVYPGEHSDITSCESLFSDFLPSLAYEDDSET